MAIEYIERALSDRSSCSVCGHKIKKGEKRAVDKYIKFGQPRKSFLCKKCGKRLYKGSKK